MECEVLRSENGYVKWFDLFEEETCGFGDGKEEAGDIESEEEGKHLSKKIKKEKSVALKNHSEAERRRRERINGHLATLQSLLPSMAKMDKATLLAEVINKVKDLQQRAIHVSKGLLMPMDADELTVELQPLVRDSQQRVLAIKASLCCDFRPELFMDLKQAITSLKLKTHHSEISTLGQRVKSLFIFILSDDINYINNAEAYQNLANAVVQALSSVMYKPPLPEYSLRTALCHKRFRTSFEDYFPRSVLSYKRFKFSPFESSSSSGTGSYQEASSL